MEAASVVIRAAEAVALAEEMEALDPLRTVLEPGQATEADEPLTLGSAQFSPLMSVTFTKKNAILLRGKIVQKLCFFSFAIVSPLPKNTYNLMNLQCVWIQLVCFVRRSGDFAIVSWSSFVDHGLT